MNAEIKASPDANHPVQQLVGVLRNAGYSVAESLADVRHMIHAVSSDDDTPLCSGYRVFPDGSHCKGCVDCDPNKADEN